MLTFWRVQCRDNCSLRLQNPLYAFISLSSLTIIQMASNKFFLYGNRSFFHRTEAWTIFISCHFSSHTNITFQPHQKSCRSLCKPGLFMSSCLCVHCSFSPGFLLWPLFYLNCFSFFRTFLDIRLFGKLLRLSGAVRRSLFMVPIVLLALPSLYYNYFSAFVFFLLA